MITRQMMWVLLAALAIASACAQRDGAEPQKELELGVHRVRVSIPAGWELLDQGMQQRFRKGELQIVLQNLGRADVGLDTLGIDKNDPRREVKSRRAITVDQHEAIEVETWNRLDHSWPQRSLFIVVDDDVIALQTPGLMNAETVKAFEAIRDSLHFGARASR